MPDPLQAGANAGRLAAARVAIAEQAATLDRFVRAAVRCDDDDEAVALAQAACHWSARRHPGRLADVALERLLHDIGRRRVPGRPDDHRPAAGADDVHRVLHVATEVYATGGHTRVIERWIERDHRRSTLLLLGHDAPLPASTAAAARRAGTAVVRTPAETPPLERAAHLRALAGLHDLVVLHVHPDDVVPALAFADPVGRPPVLLFNHAGHQLWTGVGAVDVVASLWAPDERACVARRGVDAERSLPLPLPAAARRLPDRDAARAALGLAPDALVLLSVGTGYKVAPTLEPSFAGIARTLVEADPRIHLLSAGPAPGDRLLPDHERIRPLGIVADLAPLLAAADLLLDTWPISGATALLDAAAAGLPAISLGDPSPDADAGVRVPHGMLEGAVHVVGSVPELVAHVRATGDRDPAERRAARSALADAVARRHGDAGWSAALEELVTAAVAHRGAARVPEALATDEGTPSEAVMQLVLGAIDYRPEHAYLQAVPALPVARRPADATELQARVAALDRAAPAGARVVAAPPLQADAIGRMLDDARRHVRAGRASGLVVVAAPDDVQAAVGLLTAQVGEDDELDVELVAAEGLERIARPGDVVLAREALTA